MNKQQVKGLTNQATGQIKQKVGRATGDRSLEARGHARELKGKIQEKLGNASEALRNDQRDLWNRELTDRELRERKRQR